jgi:hypothetical protein
LNPRLRSPKSDFSARLCKNVTLASLISADVDFTGQVFRPAPQMTAALGITRAGYLVQALSNMLGLRTA